MTSVEQILEKSNSLYDLRIGERPYGYYGALGESSYKNEPIVDFAVETPLSKTDIWKFDIENQTWKASGGRILVFDKDEVVTSKIKPKNVADYFFNREKYNLLGAKIKIPFGQYGTAGYITFSVFNDVQFSPVVRLLWFLGKTKDEIDGGYCGEFPWAFYLFYFALTRSRRDLEVLKNAHWQPWGDNRVNIDYPTFSNFKKFYYDLYRKLTKTKEDRDKRLFSEHLWCIYRGMRGDHPDGIPLGGKRLRIGDAKSAQEACEYLYNIYCMNGFAESQATVIKKEKALAIHPLWGTW